MSFKTSSGHIFLTHEQVDRIRAEARFRALEDAMTDQEKLVKALEEISRLRLATDEGSLAKRADRMWEIAEAVLGRPVPGAKPFP